MAGPERPCPPIDPQQPGAGESTACGSPVRWDDDDGGDGDGMAALAGLGLFEEEADDPPTKIGKASTPDTPTANEDNTDMTEDFVKKGSRQYFYYGAPIQEHTGIWVPVSVPPMTEHDREEWHKGFGCNGGFFPEEEFKWELDEENKEMTMWDVFSEMVVAAKDKAISVASYDLRSWEMWDVGDVQLFSPRSLEGYGSNTC